MAWAKNEEHSKIIEEKITKLGELKKETTDPGANIVVNFSFPKNYKKLLNSHFKDRGSNLSVGVREILISYMKEKNII